VGLAQLSRNEAVVPAQWGRDVEQMAEQTEPACHTWIRVQSGFYEGLEWPLDCASTVVGRGRNADLVLNEATISRAHALFAFKGMQLFVQDLGSTNGTLVNGTREEQIDLKDGDELQMGKLELRVIMKGSANG